MIPIRTKVIVKNKFKGEIEGQQSFSFSGTNKIEIGYRVFIYDGYEYQKLDPDVIVVHIGDKKGTCIVSLLSKDVEIDKQYYREEKINHILNGL